MTLKKASPLGREIQVLEELVAMSQHNPIINYKVVKWHHRSRLNVLSALGIGCRRDVYFPTKIYCSNNIHCPLEIHIPISNGVGIKVMTGFSYPFDLVRVTCSKLNFKPILDVTEPIVMLRLGNPICCILQELSWQPNSQHTKSIF